MMNANQYLNIFKDELGFSFEFNFEEFNDEFNLITISKKLKNHINVFNFSLDSYQNFIKGGWMKPNHTPPLGFFYGDWIVKNLKTEEIEIRINDYYDFALLYKIAKNEYLFLELFLDAAKIVCEFTNKGNSRINGLIFGLNIYKRRELRDKFSIKAGGNQYFEFWKIYWFAYSDEEIIEAGLIGYDLDLPQNIIIEDDRYIDLNDLSS